MDLQTLFQSRAFNIGDRVYLNVPEGEPGIIFAYIVYETHLEYYVRTATGLHQIEEVSLCSHKQII